MPIRPFLPDHAFSPEAITAMSFAFERVCAEMGLTEKSDRLRGVIAKRIIDLTINGSYSDPDKLYAAVITSFKRGE